MNDLVRLLHRPQTLMQKRKKRLVEYAKYKAIKDRGDKPDRKTAEQGEQFLALNDTIKDELPKLFALIARLVEACLKNYVDVQARWHSTWQRKVGIVLEAQQIPKVMAEIEPAFKSDFQYPEAEMLALAICNGAMLAESANFLGSTTTLANISERDSVATSRATATLAGSTRTGSIGSEQSPGALLPGQTKRSSDSSLTPAPLPSPRTSQEVTARAMQMSNGQPAGQRYRSNSNTVAPSSYNRLQPSVSSTSTAGNRNGSVPGNGGTFFFNPSPNPTPPITAGTTPRYSADSEMSHQTRPASGQTYFNSAGSSQQQTQNLTFFQQSPRLSQNSPQFSPSSSMPRLSLQSQGSQGNRKTSASMSSVFSSAMPMSDSPTRTASLDHWVTNEGQQRDPKVIFLAASLFEFNIDRARQEAGYPYLTYVPGEVSFLSLAFVLHRRSRFNTYSLSSKGIRCHWRKRRALACTQPR